MAESVKFTEGVNQIEGASLSAPYDLRNAYIEPSHIVKALNSPTSDTSIPNQTDSKVLLKHAGEWFKARSGDYYQSILYTSDKFPSRIDAYHQKNLNADRDVPRIVSIENTRDGGASLYDNRLIMYAFIPINHRGEAGVWRYKMHNTGGRGVLPIWEINTNENTQYVEVYRTAEMREDIQGEVSQVQALHYLRRASSDTSPRGLVEEYYTSGPPESDAIDSYETESEYKDGTVDYIYLSHKKRWDKTDFRWSQNDMDLAGRDLTGWRVIFRDLWNESNHSLSTGKEYFVRSKSDDYKLFLEETKGNDDLTHFDADAVLKRDSPFLGIGVDVYEGVRVDLLPPSNVEKAGGNILVIDGRQWAYDTGEESEERPNQPEARILERDRTLHGRSKITDSVSSADVSSSSFVLSGDRTDFYKEDKVLVWTPDLVKVTVSSFTGEARVGGSSSGDATLTLSSAPSGDLYVRLESIRERRNGNVVINYDVQNGNSPYDVRMERRATGKDSTSDFNRIKTETRQSSGTYEIIDDDAPESGGWDYRIEVHDGTDTVQSGASTIYLRTSGFD